MDNCRAGGSAIALTLRSGNQATVVNSTITGQGDCLIIAECQDGYNCSGSGSIALRNSIFQGNPEFGQAGDTTCLVWYGTVHDPFDIDYAIVNGVKNEPDPCPAHSQCGVSPGLVNSSIDAFDAHLRESSPAIDAGDNTLCPTTDYDSRVRSADGDKNGEAVCDMGAYEWWVPVAWVYLPLSLKGF